MAKERQRVLATNSNEDLLVLRNLTKRYGAQHRSQYRVAVNQLCLRMRKAEVCLMKYCIVFMFIMFMY